MNLLNNRRIIVLSTVFLMIIFFTVQFFQMKEVEVLLRNELENISLFETTNWKVGYSSEEQLIIDANKNLPTFRKKSQSNSRGTSNSEVGFPGIVNLETIEPTKKNTPVAKREVENTICEAIYSYAQQNHAASYSTSSQNNSNKTSTIQPNNAVSFGNTGIQSVAYLGAKTPAILNTTSNSFLANNSLSLSTDLSANNSPMMIDGESNPGNPGVPVGDGMEVLMVLVIVHGLIKISNKRQAPLT